MKCRVCDGGEFASLVDLGQQPIANSLAPTRQEAFASELHPLEVMTCEKCGFCQLSYDVAPENIFNKNYMYSTQFSRSYVEQCHEAARNLVEEFDLAAPGKLLVEVASNDGYLLEYFKALGINCVGIEPSESVAQISKDKGIVTECSFLTSEFAIEFKGKYGETDCVIANNVLAHTPFLKDFLTAVSTLLSPAGFAAFEFPTITSMLKDGRFDSVYHEHYSYIGLKPLSRLLNEIGLRAFKVEFLSSHGGSYRLFVDRNVRPVDVSVQRAIDEEKSFDPLEFARSSHLQTRANLSAKAFRDELNELKALERSVAGASAPAKASTFINFAQVDSHLLPFIADASPLKVGKWIPGAGIPVVDYGDLKNLHLEKVFIFAWNLEHEIRQRVTQSASPSSELDFSAPY